MRHIVLPLPPTDNRLRMPVARGRKVSLIKTPEYRAWSESAAIDWEIWQRDNPGFQPFTPDKNRQHEFTYQLFLKDWRTDIFNYNKAIADFLGGNKETARLFTDDHYVALRLILPVKVDKGNPRVEISPIPL